MPSLRHFPPVHAHVRARGLSAALRAVWTGNTDACIAQAVQALERLYPMHQVRLVDSGTTALRLALELTRPSAPTRPVVALPAYACPDLGTAADGAGFRIRLYDVDPHTLQPDLSSVERVLGEGVSHVVAAHLFGRLVDVAEVARIAQRFGVTVIEDAAQHAGGTLRGVRGGALAPISILSFGRGKGINAGGGGALLGVIRHDRLSLHGPSRATNLKIVLKSVAASVFSNPWLYWVPSVTPGLKLGETVYHQPGEIGEFPAASAALLVDALAAEAHLLAERQSVEAWYDVQLEGCEAIRIHALPEGSSGALRYPVRLPVKQAQALSRLGVVRSYPRTLGQYPEIAARLEGTVHTPGADELAATLHTLPTHRLLHEADRRRIVAALHEISARSDRRTATHTPAPSPIR